LKEYCRFQNSKKIGDILGKQETGKAFESIGI
jgi:hypothetical protein